MATETVDRGLGVCDSGGYGCDRVAEPSTKKVQIVHKCTVNFGIAHRLT
jgi:hypothetical protein